MSATLQKHDRTPRILVVDDNDASRYATVRVLQVAGFPVEEAATGREALDKARAGADLIVLDINLPDIDGFEVCRQLRADPRTIDLPICYLSATFTDSSDIARGIRTGADSYLTHPADPIVLLATVRALLFVSAAHAEKRAADARFRALFDVASNGIAMLDAGLRFTDVNAALCSMLGQERTTLIGHPLRDFVSASPESDIAALEAALKANRSWSGALRIQTRSGGYLDTEWQILPETGTETRITIASDVTARKQLEVAREHALASEQAARSEAERSNQLKDEFLATLSHELRNPLNAILGWSEVLKRTTGLPAEVMKTIAAIERNARLQGHLIADLLDFAGIRFGKMRLERARIDARQALRGAVEVVSPQASAKQIEIDWRRLDHPIWVLADEARLQQVYWNLLSNAVKFTPENGRITITVSDTDKHFTVAISDTGRGISPEFLPRLFDRFSQQDAGSTRNFAGLGIGLTIARHLITMHGGSISVHSEGIGHGACFTVRIPILQGSAPPPELPGERTLQGVRVLVVEDLEDTRALVNRLLSDAGAEVREAASAEEALAEVRREVPDVLISDLGIPRTDGYELLRTLRARGYTPQQLPAVALTAFVRLEDRSEALEAGFQIHLGKPINPTTLIEAILSLTRPAQVEPKSQA
jgi:PAS domain S-box-containing protein